MRVGGSGGAGQSKARERKFGGLVGWWVDGSMGRWVDGSMGLWVVGLMGWWADGSMSRWVAGSVGVTTSAPKNNTHVPRRF